jgi:hypothetical protein
MKLFDWLDDLFSKNEILEIAELQRLNAILVQDNIDKEEEINNLEQDILTQEKELDDYKDKEDKQLTNSILENYWNTKRPNNNDLQYPARPMIDSNTGLKTDDLIQIDPRIFFQNDCTLPKFTGTYDQIAEQAHLWVARNIKYTTDKKPSEHWQFAYETIYRGKGDCEDMGILIANIILNSGVPYWRIRINAGDCNYENNKFGHGYCTYLAEKDNKWRVLDGCFLPNECTDLKLKWENAEKYIRIWFSFNSKYIFGDLPKED